MDFLNNTLDNTAILMELPQLISIQIKVSMAVVMEFETSIIRTFSDSAIQIYEKTVIKIPGSKNTVGLWLNLYN